MAPKSQGIFLTRRLALAAGLLLCRWALAEPQGVPPTAAIAAPDSASYPGTIILAVDATDINRHIFRVRETLPVAGAGAITLLFPKWLPGEHAPVGPIGQLAGLVISANGKRLEWKRDPVEMTAFHLKVPEGVNKLEIEMDRLAISEEKFAGTVVTSTIIAVKWSSLSLYPAGFATSGISIKPSVILPHGWQAACGLDGMQSDGDKLSFAATSYETLVDSPLYAGRYVRRFDLDPGSKIPVHLTAFADHEEDLDAKPEQIEQHRALIQQTDRLFGVRHFDHYDFLLALNERMSDLGIEHHRSSENGYLPKYFTEWELLFADHDLLAHEYSHSWNGKYRRPADLWTADYNQPMRNSLLWVYEGQTQYWGYVLTTRAGLENKAQMLDHLAADAATYNAMPGRTWRSLQDTTNGEIIGSRDQRGYSNFARSLDYYVEGAFIWLDVDTLIREKTQGSKSLDDFARAFFGMEDGKFVPNTYRFEDVAAALNGILPYDWAGFLRSRLDGHGPGAPLDGLARGGYRLVYNELPNAYLNSSDAETRNVSLLTSLGVIIGHDGVISDVAWNSPAFKAGLPPGAQVIAVNSYAFEGADQIKSAIAAAAKPGSPPIELLIKADDRYRLLAIDYHDGLRLPHLEPIPGQAPLIDKILDAKS
jgi:predicted metalloprotease with PDZ domain